MSDEESGLPTPSEPNVEEFAIKDYRTDEYSEVRTLEEAIDFGVPRHASET